MATHSTTLTTLAFTATPYSSRGDGGVMSGEVGQISQLSIFGSETQYFYYNYNLNISIPRSLSSIFQSNSHYIQSQYFKKFPLPHSYI